MTLTHSPLTTARSALDEPILPDDYPVYAGYAYVADGKVISSDVEGSVARLKRAVKATEIRRCDLVGRALC
jgi:hypothetical protein